MIKDVLAKLFSKHVMPDYEAHKRAAQMNTSANEVSLRQELKSCKQRMGDAEDNVKILIEMSDKIVKNAFSVPDEQMLPFVHETVITIENRMRYLK